MRESCGELDLEQKSLGADLGRDFRPQHLERDLAIVAEIVSEEDDRHAALAELAIDRIAAGECRFEAGLQGSHRGITCRARRGSGRPPGIGVPSDRICNGVTRHEGAGCIEWRHPAFIEESAHAWCFVDKLEVPYDSRVAGRARRRREQLWIKRHAANGLLRGSRLVVGDRDRARFRLRAGGCRRRDRNADGRERQRHAAPDRFPDTEWRRSNRDVHGTHRSIWLSHVDCRPTFA